MLPTVATGFASSQAASPSRRERPGVALTGVAAITALALIIRLATATAQSFWLDEAYTEHLIHLGFGTMLSTIPRTESTPPLYYVIAWGWTHVFGSGELGLRSISAVAGAGTVTCAWQIADRLAGARAALIAGGLLAVSPLMVWYSQEARAYALAGLLTTASLLCLLRYMDSGRSGWLRAWVVTAGLGLCTHYFVGFAVAAEVAWLLHHRHGRTEVRLAVGAVAVVIIALVPLALAQQATGHADYIAQGSLATRALQVPKQFLVGYVSPVQALTTVAALLLVLAGSAGPLLRDRSWAHTPAALVLTVGLSCTVLPLLLAIFGLDFVDTRNLLVGLAPLLIVVAVGFASPAAHPAGPWLAAMLAALSMLVVVIVNTDLRYQRSDWAGASQALGLARVARVIVVSPGAALLPLEAYQPGLSLLSAPRAVRELDIVGVALPVEGSGLGAPPRLHGTPQLPAGFVPAGSTFTRGFTLQRYRAATPVSLSPSQLAFLHPAPDGAFLAQTPTRG